MRIVGTKRKGDRRKDVGANMHSSECKRQSHLVKGAAVIMIVHVQT